MWVLNAFYAAIVNFLLVMMAYGYDADKENGKVTGLFSMGTCLYTTIVITVNIGDLQCYVWHKFVVLVGRAHT